MFTTIDLQQIAHRGTNPETILQQIENFKKGFPFAELTHAATVGHGIHQFDEQEINRLCDLFEREASTQNILKFVPASGAATRMFKDLFEFEVQYQGEDLNIYPEAQKFLTGIKQFAFYHDLQIALQKQGKDLEKCLQENDYKSIMKALLDKEGLNYGQLPKALIKFHGYAYSERTSLEEHLVEGNGYAKNNEGQIHLHFTVSEEHLDLVKAKIEEVKHLFEKEFNAVFDISFSIQKSSTDTIAVTENNELFRDKNGTLVFRPGGHGALIQNLNEQHADLIFIKNIDNIVPDRLKPETFRYKKLIGGLLLKLQQQIFAYLHKMDGSVTEAELMEIENFTGSHLGIQLPDAYKQYDFAGKLAFLRRKLNRPIRVCGMVKNEGEPGGGPFWVRNSRGEVNLQIVESSQVDKSNAIQIDLFKQATHFNPVDLVCATRNYKGEKFDLTQFVDADTGFISLKSKDGKALKAQELPGLWNGAMADWTTLFVEVPSVTFNPVKTVNDLLRKEHQS